MADKHPAVIAWEKWAESVEGQNALREGFILKPYLENRLNHAFMGGYNSCENRNTLLEKAAPIIKAASHFACPPEDRMCDLDDPCYGCQALQLTKHLEEIGVI